MKKNIPNMITCCNLLCGAIATWLAMQNAFAWAFAFILFGAVFDFFDGMTARLLGISSPIGKELDSLADDITFGLAPAMMVSCYLRPSLGWWSLVALLMAAFSAFRLAKFNLDTRQTLSFIGLATPANAIFWGSLCCMPYALTSGNWMPWILLSLTLVSCYLLVSEIPFFSLKFHNLSWADNQTAYIFLIGCILLIACCVVTAIRYSTPGYALFAGAACILWYIVMNLCMLQK